MDYLLLNRKKVCAIKVQTRTGRVRLDPNSSRSFPRSINFWCSERPLPQNSYEIKLRGLGIVPVNIRTVAAPGLNNYHASAEVVVASSANIPTGHRTTRNRRIPGRATGYVILIVRWPSGTFTGMTGHSTKLDSAIRLFKKQLHLVPFAERELAAARFDAQVRKKGGG
jgi:hypothetical protein